MCQEIEREPLNLKRIQILAWELKRWSFSRNRESMGFVTTTRLGRLMEKLSTTPDDALFMENIVSLLNILNGLNFQVDLWKAQNIFFDMRLKYYSDKKKKALENDVLAQRWVSSFELLGEFLGVAV
jgi:hypothetical protein